jgi:predicted transcriptional regulator
MHNEMEITQLLQFFKAMSDKSRLRIVGMLFDRDMCVDELASELRKSPANISHHLKRLSEAGLVEAYAKKHFHYYRIRPDEMNRLSRKLYSFQSKQPENLEDFSDYETKAVKDFFVDGRLKGIPSQRKKRLAILKYILKTFDPGQRYHEKELNERIRVFHDDCATIRREFVINKMMDRKAGYYWRID